MDEEERTVLRNLDEVVNGIVAKAMESYDNNDAKVAAIIAKVVESYEGYDEVELAGKFDYELRKEGFAMKFLWLWKRANDALDD